MSDMNGVCKCGCGMRTAKFSSGQYASYRAGHHPKAIIRGKKKTPSVNHLDVDPKNHVKDKKSFVIMQDQGLVDAYVRLQENYNRLKNISDQARHEIDFSISYIDRTWSGSPEVRDILLLRLKNMLKKMNSHHFADSDR